MEIKMHTPDGRDHALTREPLEIGYDAEHDLFSAVAAGNDDLASDPQADALFVRTLRFLIASDGTIVGFQILGFSTFNPEEGNIDLLYTPRFSAPDLGLQDAAA